MWIRFLFGFMLIPASIVLHSWNEYRTIHRSRGLLEAEQDARLVVDARELRSDWDGQLVHMIAPAETDEVLVDDTFGVRANVIHLARRVEMFQWVEHESSDSDNHKHYDYDLKWRSGRVASEQFHRGGYTNPKPAYAATKQSAQIVDLGSYRLSQSLQEQMDQWRDHAANFATIRETIGEDELKRMAFEGGKLYRNHDNAEPPNPSRPNLGDLRIWFEVVEQGNVSILTGLSGSTFKSYSTSNGEKINRLLTGEFSLPEVVEKLRLENTMTAWGLRGLGMVICMAGVSLVLRPLVEVVSWLPMLGDLAKGALVWAGLVIAFAISSVTVAIAWVAVRPLLAVVLVALALIALIPLRRLLRSVRNEPPVLHPQ